MEWIMNEVNDFDHYMDRDAVEGPVVCVGREEVLPALNEIKKFKNENRKSPWTFRSIIGVDCG